MPDYTPVEIDPRDRPLLERIGRLRVLAWSTVMPDAAARTPCWLDGFELAARHWAIFHDGEPVASARMSVHQRIEEVPDAEVYAGVFAEPPPAPIASINRLVTHPSFRGRGFSRMLDEVRVRTAWAMGCSCVLGATPSGPDRVSGMAELGFRAIGLPATYPTKCYLAGLTTQVMLLLAPRGSKLAEANP